MHLFGRASRHTAGGQTLCNYSFDTASKCRGDIDLKSINNAGFAISKPALEAVYSKETKGGKKMFKFIKNMFEGIKKFFREKFKKNAETPKDTGTTEQK